MQVFRDKDLIIQALAFSKQQCPLSQCRVNMQLGRSKPCHKTHVALTLEMQGQVGQLPDKELLFRLHGGNLDPHMEPHLHLPVPISICAVC